MGPLAGNRIIELSGLGPGPMAAMMLGDLGADVIRIDRTRPNLPERFSDPRQSIHNRSRRSIAIDLQKREGIDLFLRLIGGADGLIEPFRPGVAERLGIGPDVCLKKNPKLVYGRITGWGQSGPLAATAGHDINYIALTGLLSTIGRAGEKPVPPLNLVGDFGGGGMLLALGMVCGFLEAKTSGLGQVVDAAMIDGAALLFGGVFAMHTAGLWRDKGKNQTDGGAPYYQVYGTKDGKFVSIGAIEPQFYKLLLKTLELPEAMAAEQMDYLKWPATVERFSAIFKTRTREEWCGIMEGTDICFAPVLSIDEAPEHPHAVARNAYANVDGIRQPAPAPRFSRSGQHAAVAPARGQHTDEVLRELGLSQDSIAGLRDAEVIF